MCTPGMIIYTQDVTVGAARQADLLVEALYCLLAQHHKHEPYGGFLFLQVFAILRRLHSHGASLQCAA